MQEIRPEIAMQDIICAETAAPPVGFVVFGASGDLVHRKLIPGLYEIYQKGLLSEQFFFIGCGRKALSDNDFREYICSDIAESSDSYSDYQAFTNKFYFISGHYDDPSFYSAIKSKFMELQNTHNVDDSIIYYLSVPPFIYDIIIQQIGNAGLSCPEGLKLNNIRLVIEKPFGRDLKSAEELTKIIHRCFDESQIYRIDHYLGKETVQNILMFRFANSIFEPLWNRNYIDHIQITIAESIGIEHRADYYDRSGALRDMVQNHVLQMLSLVAMEPPTSFQADSIRDEKVKLLRSIRPIKYEKSQPCNFIRARYSKGVIEGKRVCGYFGEEGISQDSKTETYVAAKVFVDNWRWKGVPFYLRTGKRLAGKVTEIAITFKTVPHSMFASVGLDKMPPNILVLKIQPEEGIELSFQAKRPGSKACMSTLKMNFSYSDIFGTEAPEPYQRLLLDCMLGDQTLFTRADAVKVAWELITPVLEAWHKSDEDLPEYAAGSQGPQQANELIENDGRKWRDIL